MAWSINNNDEIKVMHDGSERTVAFVTAQIDTDLRYYNTSIQPIDVTLMNLYHAEVLEKYRKFILETETKAFNNGWIIFTQPIIEAPPEAPIQ